MVSLFIVFFVSRNFGAGLDSTDSELFEKFLVSRDQRKNGKEKSMIQQAEMFCFKIKWTH